MHRLCCTVAVCFLTVASANGAEIVIRQRAVNAGPVICLGDVAEVRTADDQKSAALAATPLMPAPATRRFLRASEVRDLLIVRGVDVRGMSFLGAEVVTIENMAAIGTDAAPSNRLRPADHETTVKRIEAAVLAYLKEQSGHERWNIDLVEDEQQIARIQGTVGQLVIGGGRAPWTGYQHFQISTAAAESVVASVRVERVEMVAFATQAIARGDLVGVADIELRSHVGATPTRAIVTLDQAVGRQAVQAIRPDAMVLASQLRAPVIVHRGERVSVHARAAGVSVRTFATAREDGSLGDLIMVESLAGQERYAARVSGPRELEVFASGATAADVASAR